MTLLIVMCLFVGYFNVDFDSNDSLKSLLVDFVDELDLSVCDLSIKILYSSHT